MIVIFYPSFIQLTSQCGSCKQGISLDAEIRVDEQTLKLRNRSCQISDLFWNSLCFWQASQHTSNDVKIFLCDSISYVYQAIEAKNCEENSGMTDMTIVQCTIRKGYIYNHSTYPSILSLLYFNSPNSYNELGQWERRSGVSDIYIYSEYWWCLVYANKDRLLTPETAKSPPPASTIFFKSEFYST